jgi:hypothetical protein
VVGAVSWPSANDGLTPFGSLEMYFLNASSSYSEHVVPGSQVSRNDSSCLEVASTGMHPATTSDVRWTSRFRKMSTSNVHPRGIKSARHRHVDIYAGMSLCLRRVSGVTHMRVLLGLSRTLEACNAAVLAEQEQIEITRMTQIAKNHNGSTGNIKRF